MPNTLRKPENELPRTEIKAHELLGKTDDELNALVESGDILPHDRAMAIFRRNTLQTHTGDKVIARFLQNKQKTETK